MVNMHHSLLPIQANFAYHLILLLVFMIIALEISIAHANESQILWLLVPEYEVMHSGFSFHGSDASLP